MRQFGFGKFRKNSEQIYQARIVNDEWLEYDTLEEAMAVAERLDTAYRVVNFTQEFWTYERKNVDE